MSAETCLRCKENPVARILTVGRGIRARTKRYCDPCADECKDLFGDDVTGDRPVPT